MNIQSISIVPEDVGCNARCKYCIAAMTPPTKRGAKLKLSRLQDALLYARTGGAQTAIITSKGETLISPWSFIGEILNCCREAGFGQRDLHTNASLINERYEDFYSSLINIKGRLTNITITVASMNPEVNEELMDVKYDFKELFTFLSKECDLTVRLSCVMNRQGVYDRDTMWEYILKAKEMGIRSIVFRELWIPRADPADSQGNEIMQWSRENRISTTVGAKTLQYLAAEGKASPIFTLPWGQVVYDVEGLNIACSTCTENFWEADKGAIKSVVFLPDNHLYSSWEFRGSVIM